MFKKFFVSVIFVFFFSSAKADDSVSVFLNDVVDAYNSQDCSKYSSYYSESSRQKKRRESGLFFASNDAVMTLKESHVLNDDETSVEVAVAYSVKNSGSKSDHVSRLILEKENGLWKINKEIIVKDGSVPAYNDTIQVVQNQQASYSSNPFANRSLPPQTAQAQPQGCPGGRCGGPQAAFSSLKACRDYGFDPIPCRNGSCSIK